LIENIYNINKNKFSIETIEKLIIIININIQIYFQKANLKR